MVSLSISAIPIFLIQLVLGKPRLLLAIAFYISLYGLKFQGFVKMFSAKHLEAHRRQGYFSDRYDRVFGRYVEFFLGYLYGNIPELDRTVHVRLHHGENGGFDDMAESGATTERVAGFSALSLEQHLDGFRDCSLRLL